MKDRNSGENVRERNAESWGPRRIGREAADHRAGQSEDGLVPEQRADRPPDEKYPHQGHMAQAENLDPERQRYPAPHRRHRVKFRVDVVTDASDPGRWTRVRAQESGNGNHGPTGPGPEFEHRGAGPEEEESEAWKALMRRRRRPKP